MNNDVPTLDEAESYVRKLIGPDMATFKAAIDDNVCGIQYEWPMQCEKCGHLYEIHFPIASDFFRRNRG